MDIADLESDSNQEGNQAISETPAIITVAIKQIEPEAVYEGGFVLEVNGQKKDFTFHVIAPQDKGYLSLYLFKDGISYVDLTDLTGEQLASKALELPNPQQDVVLACLGPLMECIEKLYDGWNSLSDEARTEITFSESGRDQLYLAMVPAEFSLDESPLINLRQLQLACV